MRLLHQDSWTVLAVVLLFAAANAAPIPIIVQKDMLGRRIIAEEAEYL